MTGVSGGRRYYLLKRRAAQEQQELGLARSWQAKQEEQPGRALPAAFPLRTKLASAGYTAVEDLQGADVAELRQVGLSPRDAERVLSAIAPL